MEKEIVVLNTPLLTHLYFYNFISIICSCLCTYLCLDLNLKKTKRHYRSFKDGSKNRGCGFDLLLNLHRVIYTNV